MFELLNSNAEVAEVSNTGVRGNNICTLCRVGQVGYRAGFITVDNTSHSEVTLMDAKTRSVDSWFVDAAVDDIPLGISGVPKFGSQDAVGDKVLSWMYDRYIRNNAVGAIVAAGAKASGKSYTMFGNITTNKYDNKNIFKQSEEFTGTKLPFDDRGIVPRVFEELFNPITFRSICLKISVVLVDGEKIVDLLVCPPAVHDYVDCVYKMNGKTDKSEEKEKAAAAAENEPAEGEAGKKPKVDPSMFKQKITQAMVLLGVQETVCRSYDEAIDVLSRALLSANLYSFRNCSIMSNVHTIVNIHWLGPSCISIASPQKLVKGLEISGRSENGEITDKHIRNHAALWKKITLQRIILAEAGIINDNTGNPAALNRMNSLMRNNSARGLKHQKSFGSGGPVTAAGTKSRTGAPPMLRSSSSSRSFRGIGSRQGSSRFHENRHNSAKLSHVPLPSEHVQGAIELHWYNLTCIELPAFDSPKILPTTVERFGVFGHQYQSMRLLSEMVQKCPTYKYLNELSCASSSVVTALLKKPLFENPDALLFACLRPSDAAYGANVKVLDWCNRVDALCNPDCLPISCVSISECIAELQEEVVNCKVQCNRLRDLIDSYSEEMKILETEYLKQEKTKNLVGATNTKKEVPTNPLEAKDEPVPVDMKSAVPKSQHVYKAKQQYIIAAKRYYYLYDLLVFLKTNGTELPLKVQMCTSFAKGVNKKSSQGAKQQNKKVLGPLSEVDESAPFEFSVITNVSKWEWFDKTSTIRLGDVYSPVVVKAASAETLDQSSTPNQSRSSKRQFSFKTNAPVTNVPSKKNIAYYRSQYLLQEELDLGCRRLALPISCAVDIVTAMKYYHLSCGIGLESQVKHFRHYIHPYTGNINPQPYGVSGSKSLEEQNVDNTMDLIKAKISGVRGNSTGKSVNLTINTTSSTILFDSVSDVRKVVQNCVRANNLSYGEWKKLSGSEESDELFNVLNNKLCPFLTPITAYNNGFLDSGFWSASDRQASRESARDGRNRAVKMNIDNIGSTNIETLRYPLLAGSTVLTTSDGYRTDRVMKLSMASVHTRVRELGSILNSIQSHRDSLPVDRVFGEGIPVYKVRPHVSPQHEIPKPYSSLPGSSCVFDGHNETSILKCTAKPMYMNTINDCNHVYYSHILYFREGNHSEIPLAYSSLMLEAVLNSPESTVVLDEGATSIEAYETNELVPSTVYVAPNPQNTPMVNYTKIPEPLNNDAIGSTGNETIPTGAVTGIFAEKFKRSPKDLITTILHIPNPHSTEDVTYCYIHRRFDSKAKMEIVSLLPVQNAHSVIGVAMVFVNGELLVNEHILHDRDIICIVLFGGHSGPSAVSKARAPGDSTVETSVQGDDLLIHNFSAGDVLYFEANLPWEREEYAHDAAVLRELTAAKTGPVNKKDDDSDSDALSEESSSSSESEEEKESSSDDDVPYSSSLLEINQELGIEGKADLFEDDLDAGALSGVQVSSFDNPGGDLYLFDHAKRKFSYKMRTKMQKFLTKGGGSYLSGLERCAWTLLKNKIKDLLIQCEIDRYHLIHLEHVDRDVVPTLRKFEMNEFTRLESYVPEDEYINYILEHMSWLDRANLCMLLLWLTHCNFWSNSMQQDVIYRCKLSLIMEGDVVPTGSGPIAQSTKSKDIKNAKENDERAKQNSDLIQDWLIFVDMADYMAEGTTETQGSQFVSMPSQTGQELSRLPSFSSLRGNAVGGSILSRTRTYVKPKRNKSVLKSSKFRRYLVQVRCENSNSGNASKESYGSWMWSYFVTMNRYFLMRSMYFYDYSLICQKNIFRLGNLYSAVSNPCLSVASDEVIGVACVYLSSLVYMLDIDDKFPLIGFSGFETGHIGVSVRAWIDKVETIPSYLTADKETNLIDFLGRNLIIRIQIYGLYDLPENLSTSVFCLFKLLQHPKLYQTARYFGKSTSPLLKEVITIERKITSDLVEMLRSGYVDIEVWGVRGAVSNDINTHLGLLTPAAITGNLVESLSPDVVIGAISQHSGVAGPQIASAAVKSSNTSTAAVTAPSVSQLLTYNYAVGSFTNSTLQACTLLENVGNDIYVLPSAEERYAVHREYRADVSSKLRVTDTFNLKGKQTADSGKELPSVVTQIEDDEDSGDEYEMLVAQNNQLKEALAKSERIMQKTSKENSLLSSEKLQYSGLIADIHEDYTAQIELLLKENAELKESVRTNQSKKEEGKVVVKTETAARSLCGGCIVS